MTPPDIERLYREFGPAIYRRCLKLLRSPSEAEDATQEVFVRAVRTLSRFTYGETALPWIYQIATRHCLHLLRDGARHAAAQHRLAPGEANGADLGHALADRQLAGRLLARFDERTALIAVYALVDGMTQEEVAASLELSRKTVGTHLNRFVERARTLLGELS